MPGFHFIYAKSSLELDENIQKDLDGLLHDKAYLKEIIHSDNNTILAVTRYPEYPVHIWSTDRHLICFEGYIYEKENALVESELIDIARKCLTSAEVDVGKIRDWVSVQDGDFNVVIFDKELKKWLFFNDVLGRLPVYFSDDNNRVVLTREISFSKSQAVNLRLNKIAIAQYLLVSFIMGGDTLFSGIKRLPPSTLFVLDYRSNTIDQKILHVFNFEEKDEVSDIKKIAGELADDFVRTCEAQIKRAKAGVVSLSGGLDSRTVAAGLKRTNHDFFSTTFLDFKNNAIKDATLAEKIAKSLKIPWQLIKIPPATGRDILEIFRLKAGIISSMIADDFPYLEEIRNKYGRDIFHFSGDGTNSLKPVMKPGITIKSYPQLAEYAITRYLIFDFKTVCELLRISKNDIISNLIEIFKTYPEKSFNKKYTHFKVYEGMINWLHEGEDRNRCAFWSTSPFYGLPFFKRAMRCPDNLKNGYRLYREFLNCLSGDVAKIPDSNKGMPITSKCYHATATAISFLTKYPNLFNFVKSQIKRPAMYDHYSPVVKCIKAQIDNSKSIENYFNTDFIRKSKILEKQYSKLRLDILFNVLSIIELTHEKESRITDFLDTDFF